MTKVIYKGNHASGKVASVTKHGGGVINVIGTLFPSQLFLSEPCKYEIIVYVAFKGACLLESSVFSQIMAETAFKLLDCIIHL